MALDLRILLTTDKNGTKAVVINGDGCAALAAKAQLIEREQTKGSKAAALSWAEGVANEWQRTCPARSVVRVFDEGKELVKA